MSRAKDLEKKQAEADKKATALISDKKPRSARRPRAMSVGGIVKNDNDKYQLEKQVEELQEQLAAIKKENSSESGELVQILEDQIKNLQNKATLELDPNEIGITEFANRDTIFFHTVEFFDLIQSIVENGQAVPITVRQVNTVGSTKGSVVSGKPKYELVSGRRRLEACKYLGIKVLALRVTATDKQLTQLQVLENFRADLSYFENADNYLNMIERGFYTQTTLSKAFGLDRSTMSQHIKVAQIPKQLRDDYLISRTIQVREINGEKKEVFKLEYASSRDCYNMALELLADDSKWLDQNLQLIESHREDILAKKSLKARANFIKELVTRKPKTKKDQKLHIENNFKFGNKNFGTITASRSTGINVKINKKYYNHTIADEIEEAVANILKKHASGDT